MSADHSPASPPQRAIDEVLKERFGPKVEALSGKAQDLGDAIVESIKKNPGTWVAGAVVTGFLLGRLVGRK